jgi:hypothetical protein
METKTSQIIPLFCCEKCNIKTNNKKDYTKHLSTAKHIKLTTVNTQLTNLSQNAIKYEIFKCANCKKEYKSRVGLWKHKNKCNLIEENVNIEKEHNNSNEIQELKEIMKYLMKENSEMKNIILEVVKNGTHTNNTNITNNNNSHNKAFNLNFFLNETCKDAMNIMDFVESIKLQVSDLESVGELGYIEGISNIIVKNLNALDVTQRPVHCTDKKRETIYIKDDNKWEKDEEQKKMHKMIKKVADKNARLLPKFTEKYPDYKNYHSKTSDIYSKIIIEAMGGSGDNDYEKEEKIIKKIAREILVEK